LGNRKRSFQGSRLGPEEETHPINTLESAEEHLLLMLRGILLRVGISVAKMSSNLGNEGKIIATNGEDDGGANVIEAITDDEKGRDYGPAPKDMQGEAKSTPEREEGAAITGEDTSARGRS